MINKGVLLLIILLLFPLAVAQKPFEVTLDNYVNDFGEILTPEQEGALTAQLDSLMKSGKAQFAIVTIKSLEGRDINSYAFSIADGKLGDSEKNNGLLLLVAVEDQKYRFEVGRGLEAELNDAKVGRIGRTYLQPNFKQGDYYTGIDSSVKSIISILGENTKSEYYVSQPKKKISANGIMWIFLAILIIISIISRKGRKGRHNDDIFFAGLLATSMMRGSGGGFGGGGFGGFGGGGFGGGGAGGGW